MFNTQIILNSICSTENCNILLLNKCLCLKEIQILFSYLSILNCFQVKLLLEMLVKKCGVDAVKAVMPEEHMRLLTNIRKVCQIEKVFFWDAICYGFSSDVNMLFIFCCHRSRSRKREKLQLTLRKPDLIFLKQLLQGMSFSR